MLKPAIWPPNRMHNIVPDYERALVMGALELDVSAGNIPSALVVQAAMALVPILMHPLLAITSSHPKTPTATPTGLAKYGQTCALRL